MQSGGVTGQLSTNKSEIISELRRWLERRFASYTDLRRERLHMQANLEGFRALHSANPPVQSEQSATEIKAAATADTMRVRKLADEKRQEDMVGLFLAMSLQYLGVTWNSLKHLLGNTIKHRALEIDAEVIAALMAVGEDCASIEVLHTLININNADDVLQTGRKVISEITQSQWQAEREQLEASMGGLGMMEASESPRMEQEEENQKIMTPEQVAKEQERKKKDSKRKEAQKKRKAQAKRSQTHVAVEEVQATQSEEGHSENAMRDLVSEKVDITKRTYASVLRSGLVGRRANGN